MGQLSDRCICPISEKGCGQFDQGADILIFGDVPNGAGLSSSAALEMVTAIAVNETWKVGLEKIELIKMSQKAEHEFAGVMCGIMDQFVSGMGKADHAVFLNCDTLDYELVPVKLRRDQDCHQQYQQSA